MLKAKTLRRSTRVRVYTATVQSQLLYGLDTCALTRADLARLDRVQQRHLRHVTHLLPRPDPITTIRHPRREQVLATARVAFVSDIANAAAARLAGQVQRRPNDNDIRFLLGARVPGSRPLQRHVRTIEGRHDAVLQERGLSGADALDIRKFARSIKEDMTKRVKGIVALGAPTGNGSTGTHTAAAGGAHP